MEGSITSDDDVAVALEDEDLLGLPGAGLSCGNRVIVERRCAKKCPRFGGLLAGNSRNLGKGYILMKDHSFINYVSWHAQFSLQREGEAKVSLFC